MNVAFDERSFVWDFFQILQNVGLNRTEKAVLGLLIENSDRTANMIATEIGVTKRTIERTLVSLQKKGNQSGCGDLGHYQEKRGQLGDNNRKRKFGRI